VHSGLEPLVFTPNIAFSNIGERCNVAGSMLFKKKVLVLGGLKLLV
jgi:cobalamin-dependent methionine synthase I